MRDWASLERGLLRDIFGRLPADADTASFRHVCRHWRAAVGDGAPVPRPWSIVCPHLDGPTTFLRLAGHHGRSSLRLVRSDVEPACARGASRGWLAVNDDRRLLLSDPISGAEVPLPAFDPVYRLFDIFLSDDPLAAPGRWMAFAFFRKTACANSGHVLAFCRLGDAEWARFDAEDGQAGQQVRLYRGLEFFRGRAYVILSNYTIAVCDVDARRLVFSSLNLDFLYHVELGTKQCLVECGGDLLFVQVVQSYEMIKRKSCCFGPSYSLKYAARVIKIKLDADGSGTPVEWSEVEEIGDYALFMAPHGHAFALPATGFPAVRAGCVYHVPALLPTTTIMCGMVICDLRERPQRQEIVRKLPLAGQWHSLSWFCPRRPVLATASKRR